MAIETYIIPSGKIVHKTRVDFTQRCLQKTLHVVQYDKSLPIVAVELFMNGATYTLPSNADVKVRWGKIDHSFVYKNILGCSEDRKTVYFDVDYQMVYYVGICKPILELIINGEKAGSSPMTFEIDINPIQNGDVKSSNEYLAVEEAVDKIKMVIPENASQDNKLLTREDVGKYTGTSIKDADGNVIPEINNSDIVKESEVSVETKPSTIVKRDENHFVDIRVHTPQYDDEPASKKYVDEHTPTNVVTQDDVNVYAIPDTIVRRNNESAVDIRVRTIPEYDNEPASKKYVDDHSTGAETPFYEHRITWTIQKDGTILIGTTIAYGNSGVALTNNTVSISIPNDDTDEWNLYPMHMLSITSTVIEEIIGIKYMPSTQTFRIRGRYGSETASNFDFSKDNITINDRVSPIGIVGSVSIISAEGKMDQNNPVGYGSFSMNRKSGTTIGAYSHAEGYETTASSYQSHAEGNNTKANGHGSHAEGYNTEASGISSHAEGEGTKASGSNSHAEGTNTKASGLSSHAEGSGTTASETYSHAEGYFTKATASYSHTEGYFTEANGYQSHAEGNNTKANGQGSHAEGYYTTASNPSEHASGQYNTSHKASDTFGDSGNTLFSVGNGKSSNDRKNAFEIWQDGRATVQSAPINDNDVVRKVDLDSANKKIDVYDSLGNVYAHMMVVLLSNQSEYDAIAEKDPSTLYIILG